MKEKRKDSRARKCMSSDPEELAKVHVPADWKLIGKMNKQTPTEQFIPFAGAWRTFFKLLSTAWRRNVRTFFVFLAVAIGWSAYPENEIIRAQEPQPKPFFEHQMPYVTARISIQNPPGSVKQSTHGTGFFYRSDFTLNDGSTDSRLLLISNRHVFVDPTRKMTIIVNKKKEDGSPDFGNVASITFGFADRYYPHPDPGVDLACVDVTPLRTYRVEGKQLYIMNLNNEFLTSIDYEKVAPGSDVLFIGYPNNFYDTRNNLPLSRKGSLSSIPSVDFEGKGELVIDAEVFEGSSGSPVFIHWDNKYRLLGVLTRSVVRTERLKGRKISIVVNEHMGLGIVVKQRHVQELINYTSKMIWTKNEEKQAVEQSAPVE